jgi:hypothetical protein
MFETGARSVLVRYVVVVDRCLTIAFCSDGTREKLIRKVAKDEEDADRRAAAYNSPKLALVVETNAGVYSTTRPTTPIA